jgi:hypothetical protein
MGQTGGMGGETDLAILLRTMDPLLRPGAFVFVAEPPVGTLPVVEVEAAVWEPEGRSLVLRRADADAHGLPYDYVAAWIVLRVRSSLQAVGLTAAVSRALAQAGLSCNVIAGFHHDHLLVPYDDADRALAILRQLATDYLTPVPRADGEADPARSPA